MNSLAQAVIRIRSLMRARQSLESVFVLYDKISDEILNYLSDWSILLVFIFVVDIVFLVFVREL